MKPNPIEMKGAEPSHLSREMVNAIYKGEKPPEQTDLDYDIMLYKKAISFCRNDELKTLLKDSLIILQQKKIDGIQ